MFVLAGSSGVGDAKPALIKVASVMAPKVSSSSGDEARGGGERRGDLLALGRAKLAVEAARSRGIRRPELGNGIGDDGDFAGKDTEAERRLE